MDFIVLIDAWLAGPSKIPPPCTHLYSVPDRSTPCSMTRSPPALTSWLPATWSCGAAPAATARLTGGVGAGGTGVLGKGNRGPAPIPPPTPERPSALRGVLRPPNRGWRVILPGRDAPQIARA